MRARQPAHIRELLLAWRTLPARPAARRRPPFLTKTPAGVDDAQISFAFCRRQLFHMLLFIYANKYSGAGDEGAIRKTRGARKSDSTPSAALRPDMPYAHAPTHTATRPTSEPPPADFPAISAAACRALRDREFCTDFGHIFPFRRCKCRRA